MKVSIFYSLRIALRGLEDVFPGDEAVAGQLVVVFLLLVHQRHGSTKLVVKEPQCVVLQSLVQIRF